MATYGTINVDEKFSSIVIEELNAIDTFAPGTYNGNYFSIGAGAAQIYKPTKGSVIDPTNTPGGDVTTSEQANPLVTLAFNNNYKKGYDIWKVKSNAVSYDMMQSAAKDVAAVIAKSYATSALACLTEEGTATSIGTGATDKTNVKDRILVLRKAAADNNATLTVLRVNTTVYTAILAQAGAEFVPNTNESIQRTGRVGSWLGMTIIEDTLLNNATAKYYNAAGTLTTVDMTGVDMIGYDPVGFGIAKPFDEAALKDKPKGFGTNAIAERQAGFTVLDAERVYVGSPSA